VAGAARMSIVNDFHREITRALTGGESLQHFRKRFRQIVHARGWEYNGTPGWRSRIIWETNMSMAYAAGRYKQMTDPDVLEYFPYWQYIHSGARHPRPEHLSWDGLCLPANDPFWDSHYPPNGWNCGCRVEPATARDYTAAAPEKRVAPNIETWEWANPQDGTVHRVPVGIDPSFDYNVGKEWLSHPPPDAPPGIGELRPIDLRPGASAYQVQKASESLKADFWPWKNSLSLAELDAVRLYKSAAYKMMNGTLRGLRRATNQWTPRNNTLIGALEKAVVPRDVTLYRRVRTEIYQGLSAGDRYSDPGFLSTSINPNINPVFGDYLVEIRVPAGYKGAAFVQNVPTKNYGIYEMVFKPGARFRVIEVSGNRQVWEAIP
jgi:hypothetical protein